MKRNLPDENLARKAAGKRSMNAPVMVQEAGPALS
jgi:hypothetical protein